MNVLLVEDDPRLRNLLLQAFQEEGHAPIAADNGSTGLELAKTGDFDLVVLDWLLPGMDGVTVCRRLRGEGNRTPVLMLTARDHEANIVEGLDCGADDYVTKPFSLEVLLARARAVSRRGPIATPVILHAGDLDLDTNSRVASYKGSTLDLSPKEYALLELLARNAGRVVPRNVIFDQVWGYGASIESNTLDAFVRLLRKKMRSVTSCSLIETVRGIGYALKVLS